MKIYYKFLQYLPALLVVVLLLVSAICIYAILESLKPENLGKAVGEFKKNFMESYEESQLDNPAQP